MSNVLIFKIKRKFKNIINLYLGQKPRILKYKLLSNIYTLKGKPNLIQPVLFSGAGTVNIGQNVSIGVNCSPFYHNGYGYMEARYDNSIIEIGNDVCINNNCIIVSEGEGIYIGNNCLLGYNVEIIDSDFHELSINKRIDGQPKTEKVIINENVFIGSNVKILKGVSIGKNSVIGNSSIVTKSIPDNSVAVGNPARVIGQL